MLFIIPAIFCYLISVTAVNADIHSVSCPCKIYLDEFGYRTTDCQHGNITQHGNLTSIPDCVPNNIQSLNFYFQDLRYKPGQFQRFENLSFLSLFGNEKFVTHTDSFRFLQGLEGLLLGYTNFSRLSGECFLSQSNLRILELLGHIGELDLSKTFFDHLGNLNDLYLMDKHVFEIPDGTFSGLSSLLVLDVCCAFDLRLNNYSLSGLSSLRVLNLGFPVYTITLPEEVFKPLTSLEILRIEGLCTVEKPSFDCNTIDERLQHVPSLKKLYLDKSLISSLGNGFLSLRNLKEIHFMNSLVDQCCRVVTLRSETFKYLRNSQLEKLSLDRCKVSRVVPGWFKYFNKLEEISLSIEVMDYRQFWEDFTTDLKNSSITKVRLSLRPHTIWNTVYIYFRYKRDVGILEPLPVVDGFNEAQLTHLELTDTKFNCVYDDVIAKLPKSLKYLSLARNNIEYFGAKNLKHLDKLETLDLSHQGDFRRLTSPAEEKSAQEYDARESSPLLEVKRQELPTFLQKGVYYGRKIEDKIQDNFSVTNTKCFSLPYRLQILNVSKSGILCNMAPAFSDPNNSLRILKAAEQRDRSCFETQSFWSGLKNLAKLEELNLNGNFIDEIPKNVFSGLYNLRKLSLNNNKLLELSFGVNDLISLMSLNLSANSIAYASIDFTNQIEGIFEKTNLKLTLDMNPLICNCKHQHFLTWLGVTLVISNKNKLNCTFENGTRISLGRIPHIHDLKYTCTKRDVVLSCSVLFWCLNFVLFGLAKIWQNRQKLRYLATFGKRTLNPYHPIEENEVQMEYDVYISYEGDFDVTRDRTLRDFVIYTIVPGLERRGVRVMFREELDAGRNLYEIITHTVRRSRKLLALLTNDYCSDMWNVFEFNQAVMEGIYTNRQVAIPVLFETLRREKVKDEICEFLRMEPVHRYSPDLRDNAFIDFLYDKIRDTRQFG